MRLDCHDVEGSNVARGERRLCLVVPYDNEHRQDRDARRYSLTQGLIPPNLSPRRTKTWHEPTVRGHLTLQFNCACRESHGSERITLYRSPGGGQNRGGWVALDDIMVENPLERTAGDGGARGRTRVERPKTWSANGESPGRTWVRGTGKSGPQN